jgi:hypothetical protein
MLKIIRVKEVSYIALVSEFKAHGNSLDNVRRDTSRIFGEKEGTSERKY